MKRQELAIIVMAMVLGGLVSFFVSRLIFTPPKNRQQTINIVEKLSSDFPQANATYFNENSLNPTKNITIGDQSNPQPFSGAKR
jgi:phosphoglycerate-specific signal transduction histidine kinase